MQNLVPDMVDFLRQSVGPNVQIAVDIAGRRAADHGRRQPARAGADQPGGECARRDARGGMLTIAAAIATTGREDRGQTGARRLCPPHRRRYRRGHGRGDAASARSSRSSPPRASARAPASASRWCTASRRNRAARWISQRSRTRHGHHALAAARPAGGGRAFADAGRAGPGREQPLAQDFPGRRRRISQHEYREHAERSRT